MWSRFGLPVIVVMHSASVIGFLSLLLLKWQVLSQEEIPVVPSVMVETQYLTFDMSQYGVDGGVFSSPNFPNNYPQDTIMFYQFVASIDYRVQIEIDFFQIRGVTPQCTHDYLDVFVNVTDFHLVHNVVNDQLLHRYCGFFTEDTQTERGFNGSFRFLPAQPYRNHLQREPCDYLFNSSVAKRGELFSSTYPGTYLPWQFCNYSFIGLPGERIHIRFRDLMLFKTPNTQHCAVDLIKLYDNTLDPSELRRFLSSFRQHNLHDPQGLSDQTDQRHITDLCGVYNLPLDVYSASHRLLLYFIATHYAELSADDQAQLTDPSVAPWRKGFYAEYEFSASLTNLDFVAKSASIEYVTGTECDQIIKSFGQGYGKLQSPNWPQSYKPQTSCSTYLLGLDDRYSLENVEIEFDQFDIDCHLASLVIYNASRIYNYRLQPNPSPSASSSVLPASKKHPLYSNYYQQELDFKETLSFCGHFKPEGRFVSQNALLKLAFFPKDRLAQHVLPSLIHGGKFQARYKFVKSYHRVSADEYDATSSVACNLSFYQSRTQTGKFVPPRSSENDYFSNSNCIFNFHLSNAHSRLLIWYDYFNIVDDNHLQCASDNLTYTHRLHSADKYHSHPFVYCGYRNFPPPYFTVRSTEQFRIHFRSNDDADAGLGFDGRYQFVNQSHSFFASSCRSPFDPVLHVNETEQPSGNVSSDGYLENTICEWSYTTTPGLQFHLQLNMLEIEGSKTKDPPQGCQTAVLRIQSDGRMEELCGQQEKIEYFLTNTHWFSLQFISLNRQTKETLRGFQLTWTIVQAKSKTNNDQCSQPADYFDCKKTGELSNGTSFCIPRLLVCDGFAHCQPFSSEDEHPSHCSHIISAASPSPSVSSSMFFRRYLIPTLIALGLVFVASCVGLMFTVSLLRTKQRREAQADEDGKHHPHNEFLRRKGSNATNSIGDNDEGHVQGFSTLRTTEQTVTTV